MSPSSWIPGSSLNSFGCHWLNATLPTQLHVLDPGAGEQCAIVMPPGGTLQLFAAFSQSRTEKLIWLPPVAGAALVVVTVRYVITPLVAEIGVSVSS